MEERLELTRPDQVKALMHPLRQQILDQLMTKAATPSEVARALGLPANKVHYHVRILEKAGIVRLMETRQIGSVTETYFAPVARQITIRLADQGGAFPQEESISLVDGEVKALMADLRRLAVRGETKESLVVLARLRADDEGQAEAADAIQRLQERLETVRERFPGRKYRLAVALVPLDVPDREE